MTVGTASNNQKTAKFQYYYCSARRRQDYLYECPRRGSFRSDYVDEAVWDWVSSLLSNPELLTKGLRDKQAAMEEANRPLRERLAVIDDLISNHRAQLERILELYVAGDFGRQMLLERRARLEATLDSLEEERTSVVESLQTRALTEEHMSTIAEFAKKTAKGLQKAEESFEARRRIIELLDLEAKLTIEDGVKVAYVRCVIGKERLVIESPSIRVVRQKAPRPSRRGSLPDGDDRPRAGRAGCRALAVQPSYRLPRVRSFPRASRETRRAMYRPRSSPTSYGPCYRTNVLLSRTLVPL
jgi:hypothetical protein